MPRVLLITKSDKWSELAAGIAKDAIPDVQHIRAEPGQNRPPEDIGFYEGDAIVSFLCPWRLPQSVLTRFKVAINFHPAPVEYPGIGCYNFAIYEGASEYGAVCHHMAEKVDSGPVIVERRFPLLPNDSVSSLKERTMATMLGMFAETVSVIGAGGTLPISNASWSRPAFTRKQLESLCAISDDMPKEEILKRIKATHFPGYPGAYIDLNGVRFVAAS